MSRKPSPRRRGSLLLAALLGAAFACDEALPTGPSPGPISVSGQVTHYLTGRPLTGATVTFRRASTQAEASSAVTDADGRYTSTLPAAGEYESRVDEAGAGRLYVGSRRVRGDLLIGTGTCIARYGYIVDGGTLEPVAGVRLALTGQTTTTGPDGWYRFDLGCPEVLLPGGTTVISISHPRYQERTQVVGRGVAFVQRLDVTIDKRR